jgi:SpoVK/Ycf46/Vps4 family AAA+-type ATPase
LLDLLFARTPVAGDVDLDVLADSTSGLSGSDLKRMRDEIGIKALSRAVKEGQEAEALAISAVDFEAWLQQRKTAVGPQ